MNTPTFTFKVHYEWNGDKHSKIIIAASPNHAAAICKRQYPGAIILKTKRDKSQNISKRELDRRDAFNRLSDKYKVSQTTVYKVIASANAQCLIFNNAFGKSVLPDVIVFDEGHHIDKSNH